MKILFADPDRDMLKAYEKLLSFSGHDVTLCFEGTQCMELIASTAFDAAIVNASIPRVPYERIIETLLRLGTPVLCLLNRKVSTKLLLGRDPANSYLPFPFLPNELTDKLSALIEKKSGARVLELYDVRVDISRFIIEGSDVRLTNEEIDVFSALCSGQKPPEKQLSTYINSLNQKFAKCSKKLRVEYKFKEGYAPVIKDE